MKKFFSTFKESEKESLSSDGDDVTDISENSEDNEGFIDIFSKSIIGLAFSPSELSEVIDSYASCRKGNLIFTKAFVSLLIKCSIIKFNFFNLLDNVDESKVVEMSSNLARDKEMTVKDISNIVLKLRNMTSNSFTNSSEDLEFIYKSVEANINRDDYFNKVVSRKERFISENSLIKEEISSIVTIVSDFEKHIIGGEILRSLNIEKSWMKLNINPKETLEKEKIAILSPSFLFSLLDSDKENIFKILMDLGVLRTYGMKLSHLEIVRFPLKYSSKSYEDKIKEKVSPENILINKLDRTAPHYTELLASRRERILEKESEEEVRMHTKYMDGLKSPAYKLKNISVPTYNFIKDEEDEGDYLELIEELIEGLIDIIITGFLKLINYSLLLIGNIFSSLLLFVKIIFSFFKNIFLYILSFFSNN